MHALDVKIIDGDPKTVDTLSGLLVETVASGGSVSFMHPLSRDDARAFWSNSFAAVARGERMIFGAFDGEDLVGTVTLFTAFPPNQPHRAEIGKLMTAVSHRGRGIASALMREAESAALALGKWHLVLDTATEDGAAVLYERLGFLRAGEIPDFALKPHGGLTGTIVFYKRLTVEAPG